MICGHPAAAGRAGCGDPDFARAGLSLVSLNTRQPENFLVVLESILAESPVK